MSSSTFSTPELHPLDLQARPLGLGDRPQGRTGGDRRRWKTSCGAMPASGWPP